MVSSTTMHAERRSLRVRSSTFHVFERFDRFRRSALVQFEEGVDGQMVGIVEPGGVIRDFV